MADVAVGHVGGDGKGFGEGEKVGPVDALCGFVEIFVGVAIKCNQRCEDAREDAGAVNDVVEGAVVGTEIGTEIAGLNIGCTELPKFRHTALFGAGGKLAEIVVGLLI